MAHSVDSSFYTIAGSGLRLPQPFFWEGQNKSEQKVVVRFEVSELADKTYKIVATRFDMIKHDDVNISLRSRFTGVPPEQFEWQYTCTFSNVEVLKEENTKSGLLTPVPINRAIEDLSFIKDFTKSVKFGANTITVLV